MLKDDVPTVCFEENIIPKKNFELPQSTDRDFAALMPIFGRLERPNLFSLLTTYITTDGFEDCGEQLPYEAVNGLLYYFLKTLC